MQQQNVRNIALIQLLRNAAIDTYRLIRRCEIAVVQGLNRSVIVLGRAACIRIIPVVVLKIHRYFSDAISTLRKPCAKLLALFDRVAFLQIRKPEPMPLICRRELSQQGLVARDVRLILRDGELVELRVRPRVIAQRISSRSPGLQDVNLIRISCNTESVHKAIDRRHLLALQRVNNGVDDSRPRHTGRKRSMCGKIIERERDLQPRHRGGGLAVQRARNGQPSSNQQRGATHVPLYHAICAMQYAAAIMA